MQSKASNHSAPASTPTSPKSKLLQLFERDMGRCTYCGLDLKADFDRFMMATEDHLIPVSKGGSSQLDNLLLSCRTCNGLKSNFTPEQKMNPKKNRREYISAVRKHILERRAVRLKIFMKVTHPGILDYQ